MITKKALVFDMDGTLNDFYGVSGWLEDLQNENVRPYVMANPKVDIITLNGILEVFRNIGWKIIVTSWLAKNSSEDFKEVTRQVKKDWLKRYEIPYDEIHLVAYGTTKANCSRDKADYQILIDDNEEIRKGWSLGDTINANEDIIKALSDILLKELDNVG